VGAGAVTCRTHNPSVKSPRSYVDKNPFNKMQTYSIRFADMKRIAISLSLILAFLFLVSAGAQFDNLGKANPISIPSVPTIQISYPLTSIGGYVNSTVEFEIYVNMFIESPTLNSISYSLDSEAPVNLEDLKVTSFYDYGPEKIDFKTYKTNIILKELSEGNHTLVAYASDMFASISFKVNSYYHITALNVLSPNSQIYSKIVPLTFTFNGEIENAHYYLYRGRESVIEKALSGNMTLENLSDGSYDLYIFVTTEFGQDSEIVHFYVIGIPIIVGATVLLAFSIAIVSLVYFKKHKRNLVKKV
jgi:hypothetical protein